MRYTCALPAVLVCFSIPFSAQRIVPLGPDAGLSDIAIDSAGRPVLVGGTSRVVVETNDSLTTTTLGAVTPGVTFYGGAVTPDGAQIVGASELPAAGTYEPVLWTGLVPTVLPAPLPEASLRDVTISPAGETVAVGMTRPAGAAGIDYRPYFWNSASGAFALPDPRGISNFHGDATSVSADGSIAVGTVSINALGLGLTLPVIWHLQVPGFQGEFLPGGPGSEFTRCQGVSPDGQSFGGTRRWPSQSQVGVVWLEGDGNALRELSDPAGLAYAASAGRISNDGFVVGGQVVITPAFTSSSWVWHPSFPSNDYQKANDFFASKGVSIAASVTNLVGPFAEGGLYHFIVEDANDEWYYVSVPDFGPNTNTNPAVSFIGTGTFGGATFIPRLQMLGAGVPGTYQTLTVGDLSPNATGNVTILGLSGGAAMLPGALGIQLNLGLLLDTFVLPLAVPNGTDLTGAYIRLFAPPALMAGSQYYFQSVVRYPGGWAVSEVMQVTIQ